MSRDEDNRLESEQSMDIGNITRVELGFQIQSIKVQSKFRQDESYRQELLQEQESIEQDQSQDAQ